MIIGLFDTGIGGLLALRKFVQALPNQKFLYLADAARMPYGSHSPEEVVGFTEQMLRWMEYKGVTAVLIACNTSCSVLLKRDDMATRIFGVLESGVSAAAKFGTRIGILATPVTALSQMYSKKIKELKPTAIVHEVPCLELVTMIESGEIDLSVLRQYVEPLLLQDIDSIIYGCSHYPVLEKEIRAIIMSETRKDICLIDPADHFVDDVVTALSLEKSSVSDITQNNLLRNVTIYTTGKAEDFEKKIYRHLRLKIPVFSTNLE